MKDLIIIYPVKRKREPKTLFAYQQIKKYELDLNKYSFLGDKLQNWQPID